MELMILPFSATEKNIPPNGKCQALDWYFFRKKCAASVFRQHCQKSAAGKNNSFPIHCSRSKHNCVFMKFLDFRTFGSRVTNEKTDKIAVSRDGGSSSGFAKQTDVKFTNSVDNMSAVLEKISTAKLGNDNGLPQQLREMINNVVTKAFSLESSLGEGLGSAMASERYSVEQLTSLGRIFQQLGNMAEANAVAGQVSGETTAGQLSDALQTMMANVKTLLANNALGGNTADLELVQLTKLAFQVLNNGNTGNMPQKLEALLQMLAGQQMGQTPEGGTASQTTDKLWQNTATQTVSSDNGVISQTAGNGNVAVSQSNAQEGTVKQLVDLLFPKLSASNRSQANQNGIPGGDKGLLAKQAVNAYNNTGSQAQVTSNTGSQAQATTNSQPAQGQSASNTAGQNPQLSTASTAESAIGGAKASQTNVSSETATKTGSQPVGENIQQNQNHQTGVSPKVLHQAAELENNPLFKQIFSRYGYSQETGVVRQPTQTAQQEIPQLPNNQQVVDSFRNLAELLLKDSNLTAKDMTLLKNFVNSSQTQLSQQDAKQLNLLLKMVQSNVPAAIQQAGQQPGMEGLPKLWAFLQLADLGSLKDLKAKDFKNANKEIKTVVSSLKSSISSEGSYQADGQKSISFVMPLYIGEGGHSYPAYINLYDEPEHEDECGRKRKDTWFRVCVLTDNIGAVDIVCQLFEGNNLNLRINFSDNEIVKDFGEYLPDIRKALYDTSIHLNDLRVGTVN